MRIASIVLGVVLLPVAWSQAQVPGAESRKPVVHRAPIRYQVIATNARVNRKLKGPVTKEVRGVPAEPVDSMVYDGEGHTRIEGMAILEVDPVSQTGLIRARWKDRHGTWELEQSSFHHPEHLSGLRMGASRETLDDLVNLAIVQNVYIHGDTGVGTPVLPTVFCYLGTWGFYHVELNGEPFENPFGWPGPEKFLGHGMLTEGARSDEDGAIRAIGGEVYDPKRHKSRGFVDRQDLELHIAFHDERYPPTANTPAMFAFEYHMIFEDVVVRIVESQQPLDFDDFETFSPSLESGE